MTRKKKEHKTDIQNIDCKFHPTDSFSKKTIQQLYPDSTAT
jgi:hypothetical protein